MKCFYHYDRDAVGTCKACGKGLCPACAADLGYGLACRSRCEETANALQTLVNYNVRSVDKTASLLRSNRATHVWAATFPAVLGTVFLAWGLLSMPRIDLLVVMGGFMLAYGLFTLVRALRMPRFEPAQPDAQQEPPN